MHIWHSARKEMQTGSERSFIGGCPMLPASWPLPRNEKTDTGMTFFFQIAIPESSRWGGRIISVFASTDHVDDDSFLPKLPVPLAGADLDRSFFLDYQFFFKVIVLEDENLSVRTDYVSPVAFHRLHITEDLPVGAIHFGAAAPSPEWILGDDSPRSFNGQRDIFVFLFQTKLDYEFETVHGAPRQKVMDYSHASSGLRDSESTTYTLHTFQSNLLFRTRNERQLRISSAAVLLSLIKRRAR